MDDRGDTYSRELGSARWIRTPSDARAILRLDLDVAPQGAVLYLETDNGDNAPMELDAFQGAYPVTRVIFKSGEEAGQGAWLYYGNQEAGPPSYDLGLIAGDLLRAERQLVTAGPEQTSDRWSTAPVVLSGYSRYLFWGALGVVVFALLAITARFLPKEDNSVSQ